MGLSLLQTPGTQTTVPNGQLTKTFPVPLKHPVISDSIDTFGTLAETARGNSYILFFTGHFSPHADVYVVTASQFTAEVAVGVVLVN